MLHCKCSFSSLITWRPCLASRSHTSLSPPNSQRLDTHISCTLPSLSPSKTVIAPLCITILRMQSHFSHRQLSTFCQLIECLMMRNNLHWERQNSMLTDSYQKVEYWQADLRPTITESSRYHAVVRRVFLQEFCDSTWRPKHLSSLLSCMSDRCMLEGHLETLYRLV